MKHTLGVIGTGAFATYLVHGFMRADTNCRVILSPRTRRHAEELAKQYGHTIARDNREVVETSDMVLAATRPAQMLAALDGLPWRKEQIVISVAAGIKHQELKQVVEPAEAVLCMPTNSAMFGMSILPIYPANPAAEQLLSALGTPVPIEDESAFESAAVLGACYGWILALNSTITQWLEEQGVDDTDARYLSAVLFESVGKTSLARQNSSTTDLVNELRLPGGITEHGLDLFESAEHFDKWRQVLDSVLARLSKRY